MDSLGFLRPILLWLLLAAAPLLLFLGYWESVRVSRTKLLGLSSISANKLRVSLPAIVFTLFILALARPYSGYEDIKIKTIGRDIYSIVDISRSMLADDISPSRIAGVKRKLKDLVQLVSARSPGDRIALILFAGEAYLFCPPTSDLEVLAQFVDNIDPELISSQGSVLADAVNRSLQSIKEINSVSPLLILFSDGEDNELNIAQVTSQLTDQKLALNVLGFGTPDGHPIPLVAGRFLKDSRGEIIISKLNEQSLQKLAQGSGGIYHRATIDDSDIEQILTGVRDPTTGQAQEKEIRVYHEIGSLVLWLPALILVLVVITRAHAILPLLVLIVLPQNGLCQNSNNAPSVRQGFEAYNSGDYNTAIAAFESALKSNPDDRKLNAALGSAYFKSGRLKESGSIFNSLAESARTEREAFESNYNLGNAYLAQKKPKDAITAYERALLAKPDDERAARNLEIARELLKKQEEQKQKSEQQKQDKKNDQKEKKDEQQSNSENKDGDKKEEQDKDESNQDKKSDQSENDKGNQSPTPTVNPDGPEKNEDKSQPDKDGSPTPTQKPNPKNSDGENAESKGEAQTQSTLANPGQLKQSEAEAWLDSLSDTPLLIPQRRGRTPFNREQTW